MADPFIFRWNISRCVVGVTTPFLTYFSFYTPTTYVDHTAAACCGYIHIMNLLQENTHTHTYRAQHPHHRKKNTIVFAVSQPPSTFKPCFFWGVGLKCASTNLRRPADPVDCIGASSAGVWWCAACRTPRSSEGMLSKLFPGELLALTDDVWQRMGKYDCVWSSEKGITGIKCRFLQHHRRSRSGCTCNSHQNMKQTPVSHPGHWWGQAKPRAMPACSASRSIFLSLRIVCIVLS